jgi:lipid-A-disaccharide synthase
MRILLSAGEVSGDAIGSELAAAVHEEIPQAELAGCAGEAMLRAGVAPLAGAVDFSHAGWSSVLSRLPFLVWKAWRYLRAVDRFQPELALVVDAPGLHGPLLRRLRSCGIPVAWVAPPQLWAWKDRRPGILDGLEVYPSHEFEQDSLRMAGANPHWWGYPGARSAVTPSSPRDKLVLLPGSRSAWRRRHRELFIQAAEQADLPLETVLVRPDADSSGREAGLPCLSPSQAWGQAALALALPGTATLEAARWGVPTLVAAKPGWLDLQVARRRLSDGYRALPNRILSAEVFPEFYADQVDVPRLASELRCLWSRREAVRGQLEKFEEQLGEPGAARSISRHFLETLGNERGGMRR